MENKQMTMDKALSNLQQAASLNAVKREWKDGNGKTAIVSIKDVRFAVMVVGQVNKANVLNTVKAVKELQEDSRMPTLLICTYASPTTIPTIVKENISILDVVGNCRIAGKDLFINIQGRKPEEVNETNAKGLTEAGTKLVFYFLQDIGNVDKTYRQINKDTGLSLGLIKNTIESLKANKFITLHKGRRVLVNRDELVEVWQQAYNTTLKPKLFIGNLRFVDQETRDNWKDMVLPPDSHWGGESGANLLDGYLLPEKFTVYTKGTIRDFLTKRKMIPAGTGEIALYHTFWTDADDRATVPNLIIYADLMGSGDSRCLEAAQRLKEYGL